MGLVPGRPVDEAGLQHFRARLKAPAAEIEPHPAGGDAADGAIVLDNPIARLMRVEAIQAQAMSAEGRRQAARD